MIIGRLQIQDTRIPTAKRSGALPSLCAALKEIYITPKWNTKIFEILEDTIYPKNNNTGRPGMDLWQIFVLAQVRLCQNISYDDLHHIANYDSLIRQLMGIETESGFEKIELSYQSIIDNIGLLDDKAVSKLNDVIVELGHNTFKKKEETALRLKTDSFVVETNVHFPTDFNLTFDCARKCLDLITNILRKYKLKGWRKLHNWNSDLKNKMRALGRANSSGGKGKQERIKEAAEKYLSKATALMDKLDADIDNFPQNDVEDIAINVSLKHFMELLRKHIDLLDRRVMKGETIPHSEKMFSIFEPHTEWINKGKMRPNVELGKKVNITTDQYHLIIDYKVMDHESDSETVTKLSERILARYTVKSWSFDKGYWSKINKEKLSDKVDLLVLPKKGKCNKSEKQEESNKSFKRFRNKHSAVESNINELENRGLDRCPDKGYPNFKRYVGLAVCAYNLRRIGSEIIKRIERDEPLKQAA